MTLPQRWTHQAQLLAATGDLTHYAIFWDQGTGKTRLVLDTMVHLAKQGKIDALLILAPNGVHQMWIDDEVPAWIPGHQALYSCYYTSGKAGTKKHQRLMDGAMRAKFSIVAMSYEGIMTKRGRDFARKFLTKRKVLMTCDESTAIKTPSAKRTKAIVAAGGHALYRRILTGTPADSGPFDVYTQVRFLYKDYWKENGFQTYAEFKTYFGVFEKRTAKLYDKTGKQRTQEFEHLLCYRNLDKLKELLEPISSRVEKSEVMDLPPKTYTKIYYKLTPVQQRVYTEIRDECMTFLETGELVTIHMALVKLLRLQQVICGYIPPETGEPEVEVDPGKNPRIDAFKTALAQTTGSAIVWARFNKDIDMIMEILGKEAAQCDGRTPAAERQQHVKDFQAGKLRFIVSKPQTKGMSRGQTLTRASTVIYYSNTFSLEDRNQSEDRAHRGGLKHPVTYIDIVAPGTVDTRILGSLRSKKCVASLITGDTLKDWI